METLDETNYQSGELKRALAVQMSQRGHSYREIRDVLKVSIRFGLLSTLQAGRSGGLKSNCGAAKEGISTPRQEAGIVKWLAQDVLDVGGR